MRQKRRGPPRLAVIATVGGLIAFAASAVPVYGAGKGTVTATVTAQAAAACITVSGDVTFGTRSFTPVGTVPEPHQGSNPIVITHCGTASQSIFGRGTDAQNDGASGPVMPPDPSGTVVWVLTGDPVCPTPVEGGAPSGDRYNLGLSTIAGNVPTFVALTKSDLQLTTLAAGSTFTREAGLVMPCAGSVGDGYTLSMSYIFTATA